MKKPETQVVHEVALVYKCGEKHCHYGFKRYCRFLASRRMGTIPVCNLFSEDLDDELTRLPACLGEQEGNRK